MNKQRTLRFVDQEKDGEVVTYEADEGHTVRQFIAGYHWHHGEKTMSRNAGFLGLYRSRKLEEGQIAWELIPDTATIGSLDLADDEILVLKLRPQTIYVTMTKPFVVDFNEPLEAVLPAILAGFGETVTADCSSRYCLQRERPSTDLMPEDRGACTISDCDCQDYIPSSIGRKQSGMSGMCRRCGHKSSTHHYRPGPSSYEVLDLARTLTEHSVARNSVVLLKKTAFRESSSEEVPAGSSGRLTRSGNLARKISISVDDEDSDDISSGDESPVRSARSPLGGSPHNGRRAALKRNLSGDSLRSISQRQVLSPREVDSAKIFNSNGTDIRKWRQRMRSLNRTETKPSDDKAPNDQTRVYGVPLETLIEREASTSAQPAESCQESGESAVAAEQSAIPKMISSMLKYLETEEALKTEGIFRLSSNFEEMMRYKEQLDRGEEVKFSECGAHVVINLLKKFLHELPDPLLSSVLYQRYISAVQGEEEVRMAYMIALINSLPPASYAVLRRLLIYLRKVVAFSGDNRMDLHNLATTLVPVLMREKPASSQSIFSSGSVALPSRRQHQHRRRASDSAVVQALAKEAVRAAKIVETMISMTDEQLFPKEANHLSVARMVSDFESSEFEGVNKISLRAGDVIFIFNKRDDTLWVEHKSTRKLGRVPASISEELSMVVDNLKLTGKKESKVVETALTDDVSDDDEESEEPKQSFTRVISEPFKKPKDKEKKKSKNRSGDDSIVVEKNRLYGNMEAKSLAKPMSLGSSNSATYSKEPSLLSPPKEKRKSIGIGIGPGILVPRKDSKVLTPREDKDKDKEQKKEKKEKKDKKDKDESKKEKKEKKEKKDKDESHQHFVNPLLAHSGTHAVYKPSA